jgi:four helix bundle protein
MEQQIIYITLDNLQVYRLARDLSRIGWLIHQKLDWQMKKIMGDQFISAIDSIGANIAEGYGRYHYLDKIKFYYNARASYNEAILHWSSLLKERILVDHQDYCALIKVASEFAPRLNSFISSTYNVKNS